MSYDNLFIFFVGFSSIINFQLGGSLYGTDVILVSSCFLIFRSGKSTLFRGLPRLILLAIGVWMFGAVITDIYRATPFEDLSRGWSKIIFFGLDFCGLVLLTEWRLEKLKIFMMGTAFSILAATVLFPTEYQSEDPWKFGYALTLTPVAAIMGSSTLLRRWLGTWLQYIPLTILGILNLAFNFRSMFGLAMVPVAFAMVKAFIDARPRLHARITPAFFMLMVFGGVGVAYGLSTIYVTSVESGWLGAQAQSKYETQTSGDLGLLLGGRSEMLISTVAIADSPILGHGSWARDWHYVELYVALLENSGAVIVGDPYESDLIPTHSHLFGAWVEAGILGASFWAFIIVLIMAAAYRCLKLENLPVSFIAFFLFLLLWDVLFSPFGADQRFIEASRICLVGWVLRHPIENKREIKKCPVRIGR